MMLLECEHFLFCMREFTLWILRLYNGVFAIKMDPADPCIKTICMEFSTTAQKPMVATAHLFTHY